MSTPLQTTCCIAGGGPAGIMLGYLLARAGVAVTVLEKHADFLRDFRGDTIHPSTLEVMHELGLLEDFLKLPHQKVRQITGNIYGEEFIVADFSHLPVKCPYIAMIPQWDFLNFMAEKAKAYPTFTLLMQAKATGILEAAGKVVGVTAETPERALSIRADVTVAADGRHSSLRGEAHLAVQDIGAPIDVLWMRLSRVPTDPDQPVGQFGRGKLFVMIYRDTYWQCAYVIPKGGFKDIQRKGLDAFKTSITDLVPFLKGRVDELKDWEQIKLLTVTVDRLRQWSKPGFLCIGDAAHAMSPVGGVGINLAIQDAVAAANILAAPLREQRATPDVLTKVQKRRELPTRIIQRLQVLVQNRILSRVIRLSSSAASGGAPGWLRLLLSWPFVRRIPARLIGMGPRPEHVDSRIFRP